MTMTISITLLCLSFFVIMQSMLTRISHCICVIYKQINYSTALIAIYSIRDDDVITTIKSNRTKNLNPNEQTAHSSMLCEIDEMKRSERHFAAEVVTKVAKLSLFILLHAHI